MPHFKITAHKGDTNHGYIDHLRLTYPSGSIAAAIEMDGTVNISKANWTEDQFIELAAILKHRRLFYEALTAQNQKP